MIICLSCQQQAIHATCILGVHGVTQVVKDELQELDNADFATLEWPCQRGSASKMRFFITILVNNLW
jgi:hypothetical protein